MASSVAVRKGRKHKMRLVTDNNDEQMVVKSLSVPPGLEALMEGLTREVLRMQPQDICLFASEHFAKLIKMREASGDEYQFCKTTIHDKIKQQNVPSRVVTTQPNQQPSPKDDVETFDGTSASALSVPRLDFGRLTNGVSPEINRNRSEASTAEIDKIQAGFFDSKPADDTTIKESNEHVNTDDEIVNSKEEDNGTIPGVQIKDDMKNIKPTEHDYNESRKTDDVTKEVNEELAKSKENVESNTIEEDNQIQEETTKDDKEICENVEKDAVTKESTEIPKEEGNVKAEEETSKEELAAHDEPDTINIANGVEPVNKEIEHLAVTDKEAKLNETEKKETGNNIEDAIHPEGAESKLEATEEHDDLSDSNDVVTQETEQEMKTMSPADISPVKENTDDGSSVEDKPVQSSEPEAEHLEDSTDVKLVDEKHEGQVEDNSTENESHTDLEKAVINDQISEKDSNKTPVHNTQAEDVQTDGVHSLTAPEISTTVATPTPSEDGSTSGDNVPKELDENVNPTGDDNDTEEEKQIKAATKLQSLWRGYRLRKMKKSATTDNEGGNEETSEDLHKLTTAATVIQALWRGYSFRKSKATDNSADAAKNITSDGISPDQETEDATVEQNIAATKIQSSWRGHNVRKKRHIDMNDITTDEEHDKMVGEGKPSEDVVENKSQDKEIAKEIMAATVIQALWRGYAMRKSRNLETENESTQRNTDIGKLNLAVAKIQALWRGHHYRKVQRSSTVVDDHEMPVKEMENISGTGEHNNEKITDATTTGSELDSHSKTDTNIIESDKPKSEVSEQAVETEKANVTESEHIVQPSESEVNAKQDSTVPELDSEKINDTVAPGIEAEKANEAESSKIAERIDSGAHIEGVTASPKSVLEDEKTTEASEHPEEVDSVSKTEDADGSELQNKTVGSDKTSDENNETIKSTNAPESEIKSEEVSEKAVPFVKAGEIVKTDECAVKSEKDGAPVSENITQELAEKVESSPIETENENNSVETTELNSDKEIDSAGTAIKDTEQTHAIDNNVNKLDEAKTTSDSEKGSETNDYDKEKIESGIIPELENNTLDAENVEVKNAEISNKTEVEISTESPENTTITFPSEDTQSEVEHSSEITKNNDNLSSQSPDIALSDAAAENKQPESTITTDEGLKEPSTTISQDSTDEKSTKFDENISVKPSDIMDEDNSEQDKLTNSLDGTDNGETNKGVNVNTDVSDITAPHGTKNTESDTNEQVDTKEHVTETSSQHPLDEAQVDVNKRDEITEPEIKKESVEVDNASPAKTIDASPSNQEENKTENTKNIASDKSAEDQKMNETDENSTHDGITEKKDDKPREGAESSEESNENKSGIISEPEKKSADDDQSLVKIENTDHVDTGPEISNNGASAIEAMGNGKQDDPDGKTGQEDSVKENDAATKIQSTWRGYNVRKSNNIIADGKDPESKSENGNETEENVEKSSEDTGNKTETNEDEITKPIVDTAEKIVGTAEENVNESSNTDETVDKVENVPDEPAKENVATEISEPVAEKIEHSSVNSENVNEAGTNVASEINKGETVGDSSSTDENKLTEENVNESPNTVENDDKVGNVPDEPAKENVATELSEQVAEKIEHSSVNSENINEAGTNGASEINKEETVGDSSNVDENKLTEEIVNESPNTVENDDKVGNVPDEPAKENVATELSEQVAEKIEHSSVNSENVNEAATNDASVINKEETVGDSSNVDENKLEDTNHETVPITKTTEVEKAEQVSDLIGNKEDTVPTDETVQQEAAEKLEETSPNSTDNKAENSESGDKLEDDLEKHVEMTNVEHDAKITDTPHSRAEDHKDTYQASEASTVDIRDVEDSLKSPAHAEDGNDLEINVHEDGEKLNESSDTTNELDADNKVKFYVGPDESNHIEIVDDLTKESENYVDENTESDKPAADGVTNENNREIRKSVTSVLLSALSDDPDELEKGEATKETNDANVPESDQCIDGKKTTPADEEHHNDDSNNGSIENSSVPNTEENSNKNIEDTKKIPTEDTQGDNINETEHNQAQNSIDNNTENIENHSVKSPENVSNTENDKLDANHDDDKHKLAMNIQSFDKALSESQNKEKESNDVEVDTDNVANERVIDKGDTEDTTSVADTQNASTIPLAHENTEKTADNVVENNTATNTVNVALLAVEQHALNSENKSDSVQNEDSILSPTNLHEDKSSESAANDSNDADTTQDTVEGPITSVEQHKNIENDGATTHTPLNTTAKDSSHKSDNMCPSDIIEEGTHATDNGNNEHGIEETHKELHTPVTGTVADLKIPHELENESSVNNEDKHTVDEVDNVSKNVEDGILHTPVGTIVGDMPNESESKSSVSVNDALKNKNIELNKTHSPVVTTTTEDNQKESNEQMEHLKEKDTDKDIEENKLEKLDKTTIVPSTEDTKDEGNKNSEHSEENTNDIKKNNEENEHVTVDSNNSDVQPASQDISVDDKETKQIDTTKDKDAKENINEDSTVENNKDDLISNDENHSAVNDMKEGNKNEDNPEDEIKIKDIESQIEHDITDDDAHTKQNGGATENGGHNTVSLEKEEGNNEKSAAVTRVDNKTAEDKAAVKIQSAWKGYHVRHRLNEDKELALLQRPAECDELPSKTDVAEDADMLSQAATTIQAGARGYLVRKRRHLAKVTEVPSEKADSATVDESDSTSQETVVEKQAADTLDTAQSFESIENAKSEEANVHDGAPKEETQFNEQGNKATIIPEETKDVQSNTLNVEKSKADGEIIMESRNDNTNGNDVKNETNDVDNGKENIAESKHESSVGINESVEESTNNNDKQELDEIGALNLRLRNLSRTNVYQTDEEKESDDKIEDDHKTDSPKEKKMNFDRALSDLHAQSSKSLDDDESVMTAPSNTDDSPNNDANKLGDDKELETQDKPSHEEPHAENKQVAQILERPKANTTPRLSVNLDDFDSSKYDLKVEHATPRSRNASPVHELTSAAYKIGAAIAVNDEAIVDAMDEDAKDKSEEKPVEYVHIPLQGPLPESVEEKPIEKETLQASQEHVTSDKNKDDGGSPEYIYIPLKAPGTVDEQDEKENIGDAHTEVDNQKEETRNETDTIPRSSTENKDDNEDNLKEKLSIAEHSEYLESEPTKEKEDTADKSNDTDIVLNDKEKENSNSKLEEHGLSEKQHVDAKEIHETLADHVIEKECDNETEQISQIPEPIPLMNKPSEQAFSNQQLLAEAESSELELSHSKSPEPTHSGKLDEKSPELELSESQPADSIVSEEPIGKLTAKENLEKSPVSETKTPEPELSEFKLADSKVSGQSTESLTTEKDTDKSVVEHTSAEPELSENKSTEPVLSELKSPEPKLSDNTGSGDLLSGTKASDALLPAKSKSPEAIDSEQAEKSKDETTRTPSPVKSTSAVDDIDAFLQRNNKSRTISRQQNVDSSSHRTLFAEIDSLIDAYGQKRQMSPTSNDHPDLASAKIANESGAQGQQLSGQDDLPDVIMANSDGADLAATKIQSAYRGYHTRQQLKQGAKRLAEAQPRKDSPESDKTYTIEKHSQDNVSTPDEEVPSDDAGMKNKAATKIQTTFREYRKKRSTEQNKSVDDEKNVADEEQISEKHANDISTEQINKDVKTEEPAEQSNKMSDDKEDENKELEESIENSEKQHTTSLVEVNDESVQQKTSPDEKSVTSHNADAEETVTNENTADSLEPHADYDSLNSEQELRHSPERGQVQDLKITKLEDKFLDHVVTNDSGTDAKHEQLKDISEITHDAATKIQSTYRGFKTRQTLLKNDDQLDRPLDTIPEVMSPTSLDVNKEHETREHGNNEHTDEGPMNDEEQQTDHAYINGTVVQPDLKSSGDVDVPSERSRQNSAEQKDKSTRDAASTSDAWRYRLVQDATTDGDSTGKDETTSGVRSDSTIHADDDSEPYARASSPDGKLVPGTRRQNAEQPAGLQHSGDMHDTLDIFLSSEELSQGAEVLTSRSTSTKDDVTSAHAQSSSAAKHEAPEQHDVHSVMESAKIQSENNTPTTQHNQQQQHQQQQQQQQQPTVTDMGNDEAVAATKIQAGFRGYQVRKQMKLKKNGSEDARMVKRCSSGRRRGSLRRGENPRSDTDLEERSATKIQAGIRGFLVRKRQKSTKQ